MNNCSLKCKLIALFAFLAIAASSTMIAHNNPYYPNTVAPPTIQQTTNDSTGAIEVNICAPDANRTETFSIYKEINGVRTLVGSGTLENDANLSVTIPNNEITDDMILEVTSKEQNSGSEFIEWRDKPDYDIARNPNNPYDHIGRLHNQTLDYFMEHINPDDYYKLATSDDFGSTFYDIVEPFFDDKWPSDKAGFVAAVEEFENMPNDYNSFEDYLLSKGCSHKLTQLVQQLIQIVWTSEHDLNYICNSIKTLENNVALMPAQILNESDKAVFFIGSSVFKYSSVYWDEHLNNPDSPWNYEEPEDEEELAPRVGSITRGIVDFAGTVAGWFTGNPNAGTEASAACDRLNADLNQMAKSMLGLPQSFPDIINWP